MDKKVTSFVHRFTKDERFVNALIVELLLELLHPEGVRSVFLHHLLRIVLEIAISTFDLNLCCTYLGRTYRRGDEKKPRISSGKLIRAFFDWALAYSNDAAFRLLWKLSIQASKIEKDTVQEVLLPIMKELILSVDIGSVEVQYCFQLLVKAYITKSVGKELPKPENWERLAEVRRCSQGVCDKCTELNTFLEDPEAEEQTVDLGPDKHHLKMNFDWFGFLDTKRVGNKGEKYRFTKTLKWWEKRHHEWELDAEKAKQNLRDLPKNELEQALGDQYGTLMALDLIRANRGNAEQGDVGQSPNKAKSPALPKRPRNEDLDDPECAMIPKRARRGEEEIES
jgi:hypothetical protein